MPNRRPGAYTTGGLGVRMTDTNELQRLRQWQDVRLKREALVHRVAELIDKAEEKRREGTDTSRDWGAFIEQMQESLREAQQNLIDAVKMEDRIRRRMERKAIASVDADIDEGEAPYHPFPPIAAAIEAENRQALAARTLHDAPLDLLHEITLENLGLARGYIAAKAAKGSLDARDSRIAARTELASQLHETEAAPVPDDKKRRQDALRRAVEKAEFDRIQEMSVEEMDLIVHCYGALKSKLNLSPADRRLMSVLRHTLDRIDAVCNGLRARIFDLL